MPELRAIPGHANYFAGDDGSIWSSRSGKLRPMRLFPRDRSGHLGVNLTHSGKYRMYGVHRLVALTWIGPPPTDAHLVMHGDDIPSNNAPSNLAYGLPIENSAQMVARSRQSRGSSCPMAKLTDESVRLIRELSKTVPQNQLAARFNVSTSTMNALVRR